MTPRLLSARDLADYLGVSQTTVRRLVEGGDLPRPIRLSNGVVRWDRAAIDSIIDARSGTRGQYRDPDEALDEAPGDVP